MIGDSGRTSASIGRAHRRGGTRYSRKRMLAGVASAVMAATGLAACSSANAGTGPVTLTYYLYPDTSVATSTAISNCDKASGGKYKISYQQLPQAADGQRQQLVRRLAAHDDTIDFFIPDLGAAERWHVILDTHAPMATDIDPRAVKNGEALTVEARSVVVLQQAF